jgi:hypothetical protein
MMQGGVDITRSNFEHVRDIKEQMVTVALDYDHAL